MGVWSAWAQGFLNKQVQDVELGLTKQGYTVTVFPEVPEYLGNIQCDFGSVTRVEAPAGADTITLYYDPRAKIPPVTGSTVEQARSKLATCGFRNILTGAQDGYTVTNIVPAAGTCWRVTDLVTISGDPPPQVIQAGK